MNRCLNARALIRLSMNEGTAAERDHMHLCADCVERYDQLVEDLEAVHRALTHLPPPRLRPRRVVVGSLTWATAAAVMVVVGLAWGTGVWSSRTPAPVARGAGNVAAFAADVSAALFATNDATGLLQLASEAPNLQAAIEAGWPCTQERFLDGDCDDQVSAFFSEGQ